MSATADPAHPSPPSWLGSLASRAGDGGLLATRVLPYLLCSCTLHRLCCLCSDRSHPFDAGQTICRTLLHLVSQHPAVGARGASMALRLAPSALVLCPSVHEIPTLDAPTLNPDPKSDVQGTPSAGRCTWCRSTRRSRRGWRPSWTRRSCWPRARGPARARSRTPTWAGSSTCSAFSRCPS